MAHTGRAMVWDGTAWVPLLVDSTGRPILDQPLGGGGGADIVWTDDISLSDNPVFTPTLPDELSYEDALAEIRTLLAEDVSLTDDFTATGTASVDKADEVSLDDALANAAFTTVRYGRSGTPDTDPSGDAWVDKAAQTTNHGNESLSINGEVLNTERRGLLLFDFTRFTGLTVLTGGTHSLALRCAHSVAVGANTLRVRMSTLAARPFTESTVTWDSPVADGGGPAEGTLQVNTTIAVAAGAAAVYTIAIADADMADLLGNWVYVRLLSEATLPATVFTVNSRDDATDANRPTFAFALKR